MRDAFLFLLFSALFSTGSAWAHPASRTSMPAPSSEYTSPNDISASVDLNYAAFQFGTEKGDYTELLTQANYLRYIGWNFGVAIPVVQIGSDEMVANAGLGNPLLSTAYQLSSIPEQLISIGLQLEVPVGDTTHRIADDNFALLPFVTFGQDRGNMYWRSNVGMLMTTNSGNDQEQVLYRPHSEREFLYSASAGYHLNALLNPELFFDGTQVLQGTSEGTAFWALGAANNMNIDEYQVRAMISMPVTFPHREEWKTGIQLATQL